MQYPELFEYFMNNMGGLSQVIQNENLLLGDVTLNFVRTLKIVIVERSRKKIGDTRSLFVNVYFKLMEGFHGFWDFFHVNMSNIVGTTNQENIQQIARFINLSRKADKAYMTLLCNGCEEMVEK